MNFAGLTATLSQALVSLALDTIPAVTVTCTVSNLLGDVTINWSGDGITGSISATSGGFTITPGSESSGSQTSELEILEAELIALEDVTGGSNDNMFTCTIGTTSYSDHTTLAVVTPSK